MEEGAPGVALVGDWLRWLNAALSGGGYAYANAQGSSAAITFSGVRIDLIARTGPEFGIADIMVDGAPAGQVDLYSPVTRYQQVVYSSAVLAPGEHTVAVLWTGRRNPASGGTFIDVDAADVWMQVVPQSDGATRYEQDGPIRYDGAWSTWSSWQLSGGSYAYSNTPGSSVTFAFEGTRLDLVCRIGPEFGIVQVSVDGDPGQPVDLYSPATRYQQTVYSTGDLAPGIHSVRVSITQAKNAASSGTYGCADAVLVSGALRPPPARTEETAAEFAFTGVWSTWVNAAQSGGSYAYANAPGSKVTVAFEGTQADLVCRTGPEFGVASVSVDGAPPDPVDLYSPLTVYGATVFSTGVLPAGWHTITVTWTGSANAASGGTYICIDAAEIVPAHAPAISGGTWIEEVERFVYTGSWSSWSNPALSGGSYTYTNVPGSSASMLFSGSRIDLVCRTGPEFGIAKVTIDGRTVRYVDLYSSATAYRETVFSTWDMPAGTHTLKIEPSGRKNVRSTGTYVCLDAATFIGADPVPIEEARTVQEDAFDICYTTRWSSWSNESLSGGSYRYADNARAAACISFSGTRMDLVARTGPEFGIARVVLDGHGVTYVDLYSPTTSYQSTVFCAWGLAPGVHSVTMSWTGMKNPKSTGTYIDLDAALVVEAPVPEPDQHVVTEDDDPLTYYVGQWSSWSSPELSGGGYHYAHAAGSAAMMSFEGTRFEMVCRTGPEFGIAKVVIDGHLAMLVDLYSEATSYRQTVLTVWGLTPGAHTAKVGWTGTKNPQSSDTYIGVDCFATDGVAVTVPQSERIALPNPIRIYVDAGHGGSDPGAIDGLENDSIYTQEKNVNLAIALRLEQALVRLGYDVLMSRTTDVYPTLDQRITEADQWDADAYICVHANAYYTPTPRGIEVLYKTDEDRALAAGIYPYLEIVSPWADRGLLYRDNLKVLNQSAMPAVIIEYGFVTNALEEARLNDPAYQTRLAEQTCAGISAFYGVPMSP